MQDWFLSLAPTMQVFWGCAIASSAVFAIQTILTLIGMDAHDAMDLDLGDGDTMDTGGAMSLFSIRSIINFFVGFGWAGVCFSEDVKSKMLLYAIALVVGFLFSAMYIVIWKKLKKLERNGAYKITDCLGKQCDVYLLIPAKGEGKGKVQISIKGSIHELDAISDGEQLSTGTRVNVISIEGNTLIVSKA